jgi:predicted transcriptional regulator
MLKVKTVKKKDGPNVDSKKEVEAVLNITPAAIKDRLRKYTGNKKLEDLTELGKLFNDKEQEK